MPTANSVFKKIIFDAINDSNCEPVLIDRFYELADANLQFDRHDLASTILRNEETGEPAWKRNLRNCLQGLKNRGQIVNSSPSFWRQPTPNQETFIEPESAWRTIRDAAKKAYNDQSTWNSPVNNQAYRVEGFEDKKILIFRHRASTIEKLSQSDVLRSFISLNAAGGILGRRAMINVVAKESSIVHLHPNLSWDANFERIIVKRQGNEEKLAVIKEIAEAQNDDPAYQPYARKIRKGQAALRRKLLSVYSNQCCISMTGPENVLQAAHIEPHFKKGNNHSTNALLLRSDIHDLFDDGLVLIEPFTLKVVIHPCLAGTVYQELAGRHLLTRADSKQPDNEKLKERWQTYYWETK
ncbi:HNH endonuclease signature motif containing protein [Mucilaginibacter sp. BT774]|uniref:HNH endonuclease signature motif containing protein n=1 Tax=Mucilaginibacter sp. BT774 TaxID=3062276 RepID=UPI0026754194|nr:HNH endonuclease [Mucilaginibacter sp. BT774]MDO3627599.1 HNH endonuclease [Mucilaginibacter sp. BT774]